VVFNIAGRLPPFPGGSVGGRVWLLGCRCLSE